jgi:hypothetical protein
MPGLLKDVDSPDILTYLGPKLADFRQFVI